MFFAVICFGFEYILPATSSVFPRFKDLIGAKLFNVFAEQTLYFNYFFNRGDRVLATEFLELYDTFVLATM